MQIQLPDDLELPTRASAAGFSRVEDYIRDLVERDAEHAEIEQVPSKSIQERLENFREFVASQPSTNPYFDDSRESIYFGA